MDIIDSYCLTVFVTEVTYSLLTLLLTFQLNFFVRVASAINSYGNSFSQMRHVDLFTNSTILTVVAKSQIISDIL